MNSGNKGEQQPIACVECGEARPHYAKGKCKRCYQRAWLAAHRGHSTKYVRRYRSDPEKRERDREASRRWKREHLGQPGKPTAA